MNNLVYTCAKPLEENGIKKKKKQTAVFHVIEKYTVSCLQTNKQTNKKTNKNNSGISKM